MSNVNDFIIKNGVLVNYVGPGGDVVIPDGITEIGWSAFQGCQTLTSVTIPESIAILRDAAFFDCTSLRSVSIPASRVALFKHAFFNCPGLCDKNGFVIFDNCLCGYYGPGGDVVIPDGVTEIFDMAFRHCTNLTSVAIPESVEVIGRYAFKGCDALTSVFIPKSVKLIDVGAFEECSLLTSVTIGNSAAKIELGAFSYCATLKTVSIGKNGETIERAYSARIFEGCPGLYDEQGFMIIAGQLLDYKGIGGDVMIPDGVQRIGSSAFRWCDLTSVTIPKSVKEIGYQAFEGCNSLCSVDLPGVKEIDSEAFARCESLSSVYLPYGIGKIGKDAFWMCKNIASVSIPDPSLLPTDLRFAAAVGFAKEQIPSEDPRCTIYHKLIKTNAKKWMPQAVCNPELLGYMCREKLIAAKLVPEYLESTQAGGNAECIALMVDYTSNKLTNKEKDRAAKRKEAETDMIIDRKILRMEKMDIKDLVFVVTGNLETFGNRNELKVFISENGGKLASSMSAKVDYLIMNDADSDTEKKKKAEELGIDIITEQQFNEKAGRLFRIDGTGVLKKYLGTGSVVQVPESVTKIGNEAFFRSKTITSVFIPEGVKEIGERAFYECKSLSSVSIPESVKEIGGNAFGNCEALTSISIPDSVGSIGDVAFKGCVGLADENGFVIVNGELFGYQGSKEHVVIPAGVTKIGRAAFSSCKSLSSISIPNSVKSIGAYAFARCQALTSISIPEHVTAIGEWAFENCASLTTLFIPASVQEIGLGSFSDCKSLVIHAPAGCYAENYAKKNKIRFVAE